MVCTRQRNVKALTVRNGNCDLFKCKNGGAQPKDFHSCITVTLVSLLTIVIVCITYLEII